MKKSLFILVCTAAIAAACAKETKIEEPSLQSFSATCELTKTALDGTAVIWNDTDKIGVFASAGAPAEFSVTSLENDGAVANFAGTVASADTYYAVYPYSSSASLSDGKIITSIPANQTFSSGSFSDGANVSVAKSSDNTLAFKNIGAILCFSVTAADIKKVTFTSDAVVAGGTATVDYNGGEPSVSVTGGSNSVEMTGDFVSGHSYYFVVYPGSYGAFQLTFTTSEDKSTTLTNTTAMTLERNSNVKLDDFNLTLTPTISVKGATTYAKSTEGITFTANDFGANAEYQWTFDGGTPATSTDRVVNVTYATDGQYDVTLTVKVGAKSGSVTKTKFVSVYPDNPLLFLPFDGDYEDHSSNSIEITNVEGTETEEHLGFQNGHTGIGKSSGYFPGFGATKFSALEITDATFASLFNKSGNFTISFWFRGRPNKKGNQYLFSQGTGSTATGWNLMRIDNCSTAGVGQKYRLMYQLMYLNQVNEDKSIQYKYNYDGVTTPNNINVDLRDDKWHNISVRVMVEANTSKASGYAMSWKLYIDGQGPINNNAMEVKTLDSYIPFLIGIRKTNGAYAEPVQGNFDDFVVYNRTLGNAVMESFSKY